eukprot:1210644-Pyramimonas_sp.AAC.1
MRTVTMALICAGKAPTPSMARRGPRTISKWASSRKLKCREWIPPQALAVELLADTMTGGTELI